MCQKSVRGGGGGDKKRERRGKEQGGRDPEAEFLDEIQTKVLKVLLLAIDSHLYRFIFLQNHTTSYNFFSSYCTVHCEGERRKP
jgi:hypothetical protein